MDLKQFDGIAPGEWITTDVIFTPSKPPHCNIYSPAHQAVIARINLTHELQQEQAANASAIAQLPNLIAYAKELEAQIEIQKQALQKVIDLYYSQTLIETAFQQAADAAESAINTVKP